MVCSHMPGDSGRALDQVMPDGPPVLSDSGDRDVANRQCNCTKPLVRDRIKTKPKWQAPRCKLDAQGRRSTARRGGVRRSRRRDLERLRRSERAVRQRALTLGIRLPSRFGSPRRLIELGLEAKSRGGQCVPHAKALHGNAYDGHTLGPVLTSLEKITGVAARRIHGEGLSRP
jgi:hypothetical protein